MQTAKCPHENVYSYVGLSRNTFVGAHAYMNALYMLVHLLIVIIVHANGARVHGIFVLIYIKVLVVCIWQCVCIQFWQYGCRLACLFLDLHVVTVRSVIYYIESKRCLEYFYFSFAV